MGKRVLSAVLILLLVVSIAAPAYCDTPIKKLGRGVCNILTCPLELFAQMGQVNRSDGPMAAITYGVAKGLVMIGVRGVVGVYETVTFPIPMPADYKPILTDPEFVFEDMMW
jgi:putative exosortase-associated protein (TIGR04073 family)